MSITDELRKFNREMYTEEILDAIADRIDAEHDSAIKAFGAKIDSDYAKLPVDADGVPIRVGDVMWQKGRITKRGCKAIMGDEYVMLDGIQGAVYAKGLTHYHEPTPEDVLREFAERVCKSGHQWGLDADAIIAEYAKRLQLKD